MDDNTRIESLLLAAKEHITEAGTDTITYIGTEYNHIALCYNSKKNGCGVTMLSIPCDGEDTTVDWLYLDNSPIMTLMNVLDKVVK